MSYNCPTEEDLRWQQVIDNLSKAYQHAANREAFEVLCRIQEAEIIIRAIRKQQEIDSYHG